MRSADLAKVNRQLRKERPAITRRIKQNLVKKKIMEERLTCAGLSKDLKQVNQRIKTLTLATKAKSGQNWGTYEGFGNDKIPLADVARDFVRDADKFEKGLGQMRDKAEKGFQSAMANANKSGSAELKQEAEATHTASLAAVKELEQRIPRLRQDAKYITDTLIPQKMAEKAMAKQEYTSTSKTLKDARNRMNKLVSKGSRALSKEEDKAMSVKAADQVTAWYELEQKLCYSRQIAKVLEKENAKERKRAAAKRRKSIKLIRARARHAFNAPRILRTAAAAHEPSPQNLWPRGYSNGL